MVVAFGLAAARTLLPAREPANNHRREVRNDAGSHGRTAAGLGFKHCSLSSRPGLLKRVTVLPCDALSVDLDEPVEAVVMINVMYALEPDCRKRLWPMLAAQLAPAGLLVFTWRVGGPPTPSPLQELDSRQVGRHTYTVLSEILESDKEAFRARYLYRVTEGEQVIREEEITGYAYRPVWDVIQRELISAGFTQAEGAERLLAWRLA